MWRPPVQLPLEDREWRVPTGAIERRVAGAKQSGATLLLSPNG
jgi:hypothetical protein